MEKYISKESAYVLEKKGGVQHAVLDSDRASDRTATVWGLVAKQAQAHPAQTAIVDGDVEVDYECLVARAGAVACELSACGISPGSLVGVCMSRSWELVATILGVLRAGCAYVPLDPTYPQQRVRYMLQHARTAGVIVDSDVTAALCEGGGWCIRIGEIGEWTGDSMPGPSHTDLAYVIYTSGSTGTPKGVAVEHQTVVAMTRAMREVLNDQELAGVLAAATICFDTSVMEILGTLSLGGTIILAQNALDLLELPAANRVRTAIMVPSAMQSLLTVGQLPKEMRCVALGGDVLKPSLVQQLFSLERPPLRVLNLYGPTEVTVFATAAEVTAGAETVTIGKPVQTTRAYILDESMQLVPPWMSGELYLAGEQLAQGYLYDQERTRERFLAINPTGPIPEQRLYRTGDLCRWRDNGEIEFLGRVDEQVKVRGFRIELEEIESALESMESVDSAAAAVLEGDSGNKLLAVYFVSKTEALSNEAVRTHLAERLPNFMVPQVIVQLEDLPRLPNGKIDRKLLLELEMANQRSDTQNLGQLAKDEQRTALLLTVRREVVRLLRFRDLEQVPPDCRLDSIGIDSLTALELRNRLSAMTGQQLPPRATLERATPEGLTNHLLNLIENVAPTSGLAKSELSGSVSTRSADTGSIDTGSLDTGSIDTLRTFQAQLQSSYPPFAVARASCWSATDKGVLIHELKNLASRPDQVPYTKLVRTGSAHKGIVADASTNEEREAIIWTTNLYLGLNRDQEVVSEARAAIDQLGTGMGTSPVGSGVTDMHLEFEKQFASLVGKPAGCLFPTGYTANLGVVAGALGENDVIVMDQLCHASIVDGARLSGAKIRTFQHNNTSDLKTVLESEVSPYHTTLVALESVYSMGEGAAPVGDLVRTAKQFGALVLVDEAHSFGFYGPRGAGLCAREGISSDVDFIMTTLSKALGSLGGIVAAREDHVALLKSSARAYIFQATCSPPDIAAALTALRRISTDDTLRERLWDTTSYMRKRFAEAGYDLGIGDGPIVTPHFADRDILYAIVQGLYKRGIHTVAVTYPIVETGRGRLRFICSASHTRDDVDRTLQALVEADREANEEKRALQRSAVSGQDPIHSLQDTETHHGDRVGASDTSSEQSAVAAWARDWCVYLKKALSRAPEDSPELSISIGFPDDPNRFTIVVRAQDVVLENEKPMQAPYCSLVLGDKVAVSALCSNDVTGLLKSIINGTCVLQGQIEPLVWFIGRMVDWRVGSGPN